MDPKNAGNNSPPLTDISVKWDEGAGMEQKLERIITQKWIAVFPEGTEAWSEFRRTGYPRLYPIKVSKNPDLPLGTYIKRLTYGTVVTNSSEAAYKQAINAHLDGKNSAAAAIWWDVD